jgi:hypothetical protein
MNQVAFQAPVHQIRHRHAALATALAAIDNAALVAEVSHLCHTQFAFCEKLHLLWATGAGMPYHLRALK